MGGTLRPYQIDALECVRNEWRAGNRRTLVQMATGLGKTALFSEAARRTSGRVLILNERNELARQTRERVADWCDEDAGLEQAQNTDLTGDPDFLFGPGPRVVVATVQTLGARLAKVRGDWPRLVVIDEAHHAVADTYQKIIDHFAGAYVLGVTATPDRADEKALGRVFSSLAYEYNMRDAIADGWLAPIEPYFVRASVDFSRIGVTRSGDFKEDELEAAMIEARVLAEVADPIIKEANGRPFMAFTVSVAHAHALARVLCERAGDASFARALDGESTPEERAHVIGSAKRGEIRGLVNCALFTEGFDWPAVELVAIARPTKSRALYTQMVGRGTRLSPDSGKTRCVVLDFVGVTGEHSLITSIDLFAGDMADDVVEFAYKKARDAGEMGETVPMDALLSLAAAEHAAAQADVFYEKARRDPFAAVGVDISMYRPRTMRAPMTEKQRATLERLGVEAADLETLDRRAASKVLDVVIGRLDLGLCTPKQAKILAQKKINPQSVTRERATQIIDAISANGWRTPDDLRDELTRAGLYGAPVVRKGKV